MRRWTAALAALSGLAMLSLYVLPAQGQANDAIFPAGERAILLFNGGVSTEGPAMGPDGCVYFSDQTFTSENNMMAGIIWKYDPAAETTSLFRSPSGMSNGIKFDAAGNMITAEGADFGGRRVTRTDMKTGKAYIAAGLYHDRPFNSPNDLAIDAAGRVYFTDPRYVGHERLDQPVMGVYRLDSDGAVTLLTEEVSMPNGIAISPDQRSLYVGCYDEGSDGSGSTAVRAARMAILAYELRSNGTIRFRDVFVDFGVTAGPDGMALDMRGNLYVAVRDEARPGIHVWNPAGQEIAFLPLPEVPSNLCFGRGSHRKELYITAGKSLYRAVVLVEGIYPGQTTR